MLDTAQEQTAAELREFLSFTVGDQCFAIPSEHVSEIRRWTPVTPLPHTPAHIYGAINLRGIVIPVIDLAAMLGLTPVVPTDRDVVIITNYNGRVVGYLVEKVSQLVKVLSTDVRDGPGAERSVDDKVTDGILLIESEMIQILDMNKIQPNTPDPVDG